MPGIEDATGVRFGSGDFFTAIINDLYLPGVSDTIINPNVTLKRLARNETVKFEGRHAVWPIHEGRNEGIGAIDAGGFLPDPKSQSYSQYRVPVRSLFGRIKFDGLTMDSSETDVASWLRVVESEMKGLATDLARDRQRMVHNDGSGRLAEATGANTGANIPIQLNQGIESPGSMVNAVPGMHLRPGMTVGVVNSATDTLIGTANVVSVSGSTLTLDNTIATVAGYWIVRASQDGGGAVPSGNTANKDTAYKKECMGYAGIMSDGNPDAYGAAASDSVITDPSFQNIDATLAANSWHRANVVDVGSSIPVSPEVLQSALTESMEIGDVMPTAIICPFGVYNSYLEQAYADQRWVNTVELDRAFEVATFHNIPLIPDRDCYPNRAYLAYEPDIQIMVLKNPSWMQLDGSVYARLENTEDYQATMYCRETLAVQVRDKQTILTGLDHA